MHVCNASPGGSVTNGASESEAGLSLPDCPKETKSGSFDVWDRKGRNYGAMYGGGTWVKYHHLVGGGGRISTSKPTWSLHKHYTHKHAFTCYIHVTRWYGLSVSYIPHVVQQWIVTTSR